MRFEYAVCAYKIDGYPKLLNMRYAKKCGIKSKIPLDYIVCPFILFIAPRFVSLGMEQLLWLSDDDLQDWQKQVLQREFNLNKYGHSGNESLHSDSEGKTT